MIATHNICDISFGQNNISLSIDGKTVELTLDKVLKKLKDAFVHLNKRGSGGQAGGSAQNVTSHFPKTTVAL